MNFDYIKDKIKDFISFYNARFTREICSDDTIFYVLKIEPNIEIHFQVYKEDKNDVSDNIFATLCKDKDIIYITSDNDIDLIINMFHKDILEISNATI